MKPSKILLTILFLSYSTDYFAYSQPAIASVQGISIPAAGNSWIVNDQEGSEKIITSKGISNWSKKNDIIRTYFLISKAGKLELAIRAKAVSGKSVVSISVDGESRELNIEGNSFQNLEAGSFTLNAPGYHSIDIRGISREGASFAEITDFILHGPVTEDKVYFVKDDFYFGRRGPSVHLNYELPPEASDIVGFYNELTIPEGNDVQGSYFMANGFGEGYFGIQVNSATERRILFSVWSPWKTDNPGEIPEDYKIKLLKKGPDVTAGEFGNEGSGGQSYRKYYWKAGTTYRFLLQGKPSENGSTDYTAWFFAPEINRWELIASFRRPKTSTYLKNLHSFLENFIPETGNIERKGNWGNQWVCNSSGKWTELTKAKFTADATARKEARLDYSGGIENGRFYLRNCGFFNDNTVINSTFSRPGTGTPPDIDFTLLK
jgi:hypothetical protein